VGLNINLPTYSESKTFLAAGSVMHVASGLFLTVNYADQKWSDSLDGLDLQMFQVQGGIETKLTAIGKTTFYGEYAQLDIDGVDEQPDLWGLGIVQAIDGAAMDLFVGYRAYSIEDEDVDVINAGARIKF
jgi:hypothetical protein